MTGQSSIGRFESQSYRPIPVARSLLGIGRDRTLSDREESLRRVVEYVNQQEEAVSVKDIAEALDMSKSYARELAKEAIERGLIEGEKTKPVIGYIFNERGRARADGGNREGELRVLTTRNALIQAVKDYAPHRLGEAKGKTLGELRKFVREEIADATVPVSHAWEFSAK